MNLWGAAPLLAAVLLGGGVHSSIKPATVAASPVIETGSRAWETTVQLSNGTRRCPPKNDFGLEETSPSGLIQAQKESEVKNAAGQEPAKCGEVTLAFVAPPQTPGSAVLEFQAKGGTPTATPVTFNRPVSLWYYLAVPVFAGLALVSLLLAAAMVFVKVYDWQGNPVPGLFKRDGEGHRTLWPTSKFWRYTVTASGAWSAGGSWATNIAPVVGILASFFAVTTAASSLFPGVALDRFEAINLVAAGIVASTPFIFSILYAKWTAGNPGLTADSVIVPPLLTPPGYPGGWDFPGAGATVSAPAGATLTLPGGATLGTLGAIPEEIAVLAVADEDAGQAVAEAVAEVFAARHEKPKELKDGATLQLPPGTEIDIVPGAGVVLAGGPDVITAGRTALRITCKSAEQMAIPADQVPQKDSADTDQGFPAWVLAPAGAKVSVAGSAGVLFPLGAIAYAPRRPPTDIEDARHFLLPQGANTMVANMRLVIVSALITMFGIGAEVGIACVLACYSDATPVGRGVTLALIGGVAALTLYYSTTAIRALADPQPGSSLSAVSGTSFTL